MTEQWLAAPGFEGYYEVSSLGRVRSLPRRIRTAYGATRHQRGRIRKLVTDENGYLRVTFRIDGVLRTVSVHRLVCEAFNGPLNILHCEADHIDFDRGNARANNLRWVSRGENRSRRRSKGEQNGFAKLTEAAARHILAEPYEPTKKLAEQYGVTIHTIYDIRTGRSWKHLSSRKGRHDQG